MAVKFPAISQLAAGLTTLPTYLEALYVSLKEIEAITPGGSNSYGVATTKTKTAEEHELSATKASFVILRAAMEAKKPLKVNVNKVALVAPDVEGLAKEAVCLSFIVPAGQKYEVEAAGVEGEPTISVLTL